MTNMAHDLTDTRIWDVNGTKYRVGLDDHGYVQIQVGALYADPETGEEEFHAYENGEKGANHIAFPPSIAGEVADYIKTLT